jgi:hypothetical protein
MARTAVRRRKKDPNQPPVEWTAVDSAATEAKARGFLRGRFEASCRFHPAALSVFQRKLRALQQFQRTRDTVAMLAQWISVAWREHFQARRRVEVSITSAISIFGLRDATPKFPRRKP